MDYAKDHCSQTSVKLQIFLQPQIWSTMLPKFFMLSSALFFHSISWRKPFTSFFLSFVHFSSFSMQVYCDPVCLQLQRMVRHSGMTTIGSPFTAYLLLLEPVRSSKQSAQYLLATLGAPKVITSTLSKTLDFRISMQEITASPPPKLIPVMQSCFNLVWASMSLRSAMTSSLMVSHIPLQAFWILQLEQTLVSTTWLAQRISCQTLRRVLVYLKAREWNLGQVDSTHFISLPFSSMQWAWRGRFDSSHTLHSQLIRSSWSSLPTIIELASSICSVQGRASARATRRVRRRSFMLNQYRNGWQGAGYKSYQKIKGKRHRDETKRTIKQAQKDKTKIFAEGLQYSVREQKTNKNMEKQVNKTDRASLGLSYFRDKSPMIKSQSKVRVTLNNLCKHVQSTIQMPLLNKVDSSQRRSCVKVYMTPSKTLKERINERLSGKENAKADNVEQSGSVWDKPSHIHRMLFPQHARQLSQKPEKEMSRTIKTMEQFQNRQRENQLKKQQKKAQLKQLKLKTEMEECTFKPKLTKYRQL